MQRCPWANGDPLYEKYHDEEWGVPVHDERKHFEFLLLETMQAGLSWYLILSKRDNYKNAFDNFDWEKISGYNQNRINNLMAFPGIVHNKRKIEGAVKNAIAFTKVRQDFGSFDSYIWSFSGGKSVVNKWKTMEEIPVKTELSDRAATDMKKRGFSYVGSITIYSHFQAIGIINDHLVTCSQYGKHI